MNKLITNLTLIASALEYFDRKTSAAWRVRSCLTNMMVWSANRHAYALATDSAERIAKTAIEVATLRVWMRDVTNTSLVLDFTPPMVRKTLGLERNIDPHTEASRIARTKCLQTRSVAKFKDHYKNAMLALEEKRLEREQMVETICEIISDTVFVPSFEAADHLRTFEGIACTAGEYIEDQDLYDDAVVETQIDNLAECLANALHSMHEECEVQLSASITTDKITRLSAFSVAIRNMMEVVGVDRTKLDARTKALKQALDKAEADEKAGVDALDAEIAALNKEPSFADLANLAGFIGDRASIAGDVAKSRLVKSPEREAREAREAAEAEAKVEAARSAEVKAARNAKRAATARANREAKAAQAKATSMADLGALVNPAETRVQ